MEVSSLGRVGGLFRRDWRDVAWQATAWDNAEKMARLVEAV